MKKTVFAFAIIALFAASAVSTASLLTPKHPVLQTDPVPFPTSPTKPVGN